MEKEQIKQFLKNAEIFGDYYIEKHLTKHKNNLKLYESDWWEGTKYILGFCFLRGRRDKLSTDYNAIAIKVIEEHFKLNNNKSRNDALIKIKNYFKDFDYEEIKKYKKSNDIKWTKSLSNRKKNSHEYEKFIEHLKNNNNEFLLKLFTTTADKNDKNNSSGEKYLGNDRDISMILGIMNYISEKEERNNLYNYIKSFLKPSTIHIDDISNELKKQNEINDKISSLILRDLILLNNLDDNIEEKYLEYIFPVDTWVKQIFKKISGDKKYFINKCKENKINTSKVAAGLWIIGANSFDILIEVISNKTIIKQDFEELKSR